MDISNSARTSVGEQSQWRYEFLKICIHFCHHGKALKVYSAVGNCFMMCERRSIQRYRDYCTIINTWQKFHNSMSISVSVDCQFMFPCTFPFPCLFPLLCLFPFLCPFPCHFWCPCQFKMAYGYLCPTLHLYCQLPRPLRDGAET